jgi:putative transposase
VTDGHDGWLVAVSELFAALRSLAEEEEQTLTLYALPTTMHRQIQTTNAIESLWSLVRQRTDQIDFFTTEDRCLTIV